MTNRSSIREDYDHLCHLIQRWNEHRLEIFEISRPDSEVRGGEEGREGGREGEKEPPGLILLLFRVVG